MPAAKRGGTAGPVPGLVLARPRTVTLREESDHRWPTRSTTAAAGVPASPDLPAVERAGARPLGRRQDLRGLGRRSAPPAQNGSQRVRLLRRPAVRQRAAALRPPVHRLRQGRRAALPDDARAPGRAPLRLGLPRPARRGRGREAARHHHQGGDPRAGRGQVQRRLPDVGAALHQGLGALRHPAGPLGRLRQRLQDARPGLHGKRHVGVQDPARQGPGLRGLPGAGVLLALRDAAVQHRDPDGRRLPGPAGPGADGVVPAGDRREDRGLDDHAVDAAVQPGARRRPRHRVRGAASRTASSYVRRRGPASAAYAKELEGCDAGRHGARARPGRPPLHAAVRLPGRAGRAERVPGARRPTS